MSQELIHSSSRNSPATPAGKILCCQVSFPLLPAHQPQGLRFFPLPMLPPASGLVRMLHHFLEASPDRHSPGEPSTLVSLTVLLAVEHLIRNVLYDATFLEAELHGGRDRVCLSRSCMSYCLAPDGHSVTWAHFLGDREDVDLN